MRAATCLLFNCISALAPFLLSALPARSDTTLVHYGFDEKLPTAKDGFYIFQNSRGYVAPTDEAVYSGYRSLEIHEAPLDGTFAELQGIVAPLDEGDVLFHFAMQVRDPGEELNIAVAGPQHFYMKPNGMLFWLKTMDGTLYHHSDAIPKRLVKLEKDRWYVVDVIFHLEKGTYDLRLLQDGVKEPLVLLRNQANAVNFPRSKLMKISFIGDLEDRSSAQYFVDDVELRVLSSPLNWEGASHSKPAATNPSGSQKPGGDSDRPNYLVNGERSSKVKGYFDQYLELKRIEFERPACLPATGIEDFGFTPEELRTDEAAATEVKDVLALKDGALNTAPAPKSAQAQSILLWRNGCLLLAAGETDGASVALKEALKKQPKGTASLSAMAAISSARQDRLEAEKYLSQLYKPWAADARLPVLIGMISAAWKDYGDAAESLHSVSARITEEQAQHLIGELLAGDNSGFDELKQVFGEGWRKELDDLYIAQNYFYSLLFASRFAEATAFSRTMSEKYAAFPSAQFRWKERFADSLVLGGDAAQGRSVLKALSLQCPNCESAQRKTRQLEANLSEEKAL